MSQVVALASVVVAIVLLIVFRSRTSLSGCGAKKIMAMNVVSDEVPETTDEADEGDGKSTIFGDLPMEDLISDEGDALASGEKKDEPARKEEENQEEEKKEENSVGGQN